MELSILTRREEPWTVVHVAGELDLFTAPQLRARLVDLINEGQHQLILDLEHVDLLDSTGLAVLVATLRRIRAHHGDLLLVCTSDRVLKPLRLTGLLGVFALHPDVARALTGADRGTARPTRDLGLGPARDRHSPPSGDPRQGYSHRRGH